MKVATIDIGTNTILMLIVKLNQNKNYEIIRQEFATPRLGEGIDKSGIISEIAIERSQQVLSNYKSIIDELKVDKVITNATSAMRDAKNNMVVKGIFETILDSEVEIISGESEAYFSYLGGVPTTEKSALIDIGGGSTEIMIGENNKIIFRKSFQIGAVRLTERFFNNNSPIDLNSLKAANTFLTGLLKNEPINLSNLEMYSVAGTPCSLATASKGLFDYEIEKVHNTKLYKNDIKILLDNFYKMKSVEISEKYKINSKRADVITAGGLILYSFLEYFNLDYTIVSSKGLRFGILQNFINSIK